jgi:hypothetical protein
VLESAPEAKVLANWDNGRIRTRCFLSKLGAHFRGKGPVGPAVRTPAVDEVPGAGQLRPNRAGSTRDLVVCKSVGLSLRAVDLAEDLVGVLGPGEWARVIVPPVDESTDRLRELTD